MRTGTLVTMLGLALVSATASAQDVTYDYDKATDFTKLKTYAWISGTNLRDECNHKRIVTAIDAQLTAKGLTQVASGANPDVLVAYHAGFDKNLQINASSFDSDPDSPNFAGGGPTYRARGRITRAVSYSSIACAIQPIVLPNAKSRMGASRGSRYASVTAARPESRFGSS